MKLRSKLINDFGVFLSSEALLLVASFISFPVLTRIFSKADYGFMSLVTISLMLSTTLFSGGMNNSVIRFYDSYVDNSNKLLLFKATVRWATFWLAVLGIVIFNLTAYGIFMANMISSHYLYIVLVSSLLIIVRLMTKLELSFVRMQDKVLSFNAYNLLVRYGGVLGSISMAIAFCNLEALYTGMLLAELVVLSIIYIKVLSRSQPVVRGLFDRSIAKEAFHYGMPLALSGVLNFFLAGTDRFVIGYFMSTESVANYTVAFNYCNYPIEILRNVFFSVFAPLIMSSWNRNSGDGGDLLRNYLSCYFWLAVPMLFGLSLVEDGGISLLAGSKYKPVDYLVELLVLGMGISGMHFAYTAGLLFVKRSKGVLVITFCTGMMNLLLNFLLVPTMGLIGAGVATLISYLCYMLAGSYFTRKYIKIAMPYRDIFMSICGGIAMYVIVSYVSESIPEGYNLIVKISLGTLIYSIFLIVFAKEKVMAIFKAIFLKKTAQFSA